MLKLKKLNLIIVTLIGITFSSICQWQGPPSGELSWYESKYWSCGVVPGKMDQVIFAISQLTFKSDKTIQASKLTLQKGSLLFKGNVSVGYIQVDESSFIENYNTLKIDEDIARDAKLMSGIFLAGTIRNFGRIDYYVNQDRLSVFFKSKSSFYNYGSAAFWCYELDIKLENEIINYGNISFWGRSTSILTGRPVGRISQQSNANFIISSIGTARVDVDKIEVSGIMLSTYAWLKEIKASKIEAIGSIGTLIADHIIADEVMIHYGGNMIIDSKNVTSKSWSIALDSEIRFLQSTPLDGKLEVIVHSCSEEASIIFEKDLTINHLHIMIDSNIKNTNDCKGSYIPLMRISGKINFNLINITKSINIPVSVFDIFVQMEGTYKGLYARWM